MHRQFFFLVPLICLSSALWAAPATVNVEVLQDKLDHPWALAFLPDNHGMLITLRGGELRHWQAGKGLSALTVITVGQSWCTLIKHTAAVANASSA